MWGGSSRAARFARGAAALRQRARQRLAKLRAACGSRSGITATSCAHDGCKQQSHPWWLPARRALVRAIASLPGSSVLAKRKLRAARGSVVAVIPLLARVENGRRISSSSGSGITATRLPDVAAQFHVGNMGGSSRAARFARGAAALRQRARQRLATTRWNQASFYFPFFQSHKAKIIKPIFT